MKMKDVLRNFGERKAVQSVETASYPRVAHQPKAPAKIQALIKK